MLNILDQIAQQLNIPEEMLFEAIKNSRKQVKHIYIPKRNGDKRVVYQPANKLKIIQYWLIEYVFKSMPIHDSAVAYTTGKSIKDNVLPHRNNKYFLKIDFKDFFPSITFNDFEPNLKKFLKNSKLPYDPKSLGNLIKKCCFYKNDILPIGYPSSPIISNIVMHDFDLKVEEELSNNSGVLGNVIYTRYADDLTFSTNKKGACIEIYKLVKDLTRKIRIPNLIINYDKTRFLSSSGGSSIITGLKICHDNHITISRKYKDEIRLLISLFEKGRLQDVDILRLKGHLAYIKFVAPAFYTKLFNKHFKVLENLKKSDV